MNMAISTENPAGIGQIWPYPLKTRRGLDEYGHIYRKPAEDWTNMAISTENPARYNPPIKKYKVSNQKVQKRDVFFAPRFLYPFHTSKGGIFAPFDRLLYFLEGCRVDQIEHDDLIAACLHCGTAAAEGGNRIAQRLTLEGIV